jgi:hypothetical protein
MIDMQACPAVFRRAMQDVMTLREAARFLRLSERSLYTPPSAALAEKGPRRVAITSATASRAARRG